MASTVRHITFDCTDPHEPYEVAEFWSAVLDRPVDALDAPGDDTVSLAAVPGAPALMFVRGAEKKSERNRVLLDLEPDGTQAAEIRRLTALGATFVGEIDRDGGDGGCGGDGQGVEGGWAVLADPAGNEFRVSVGREERHAGEPLPTPKAVVLRRADEGYPGVQGGVFTQGVSAETVDTKALCLHEVRIPPHSSGRPHLHAGHESAIYVISGRHEIRHGEGLAECDELGPGDMVFIPADTPHMPVTRDEAVLCIVARTDPSEQESVHLLTDGAPA
ncbi:VOC family protein [Streptomyces sp. NPDC021093]|uniref:VOC family protein n=1 Tax=Streptomyces sp. NPDC021093 TaxID=3365112 RepID=UPI0037A9526C